MGSASIWHWFILLLVGFLWVFPIWRILERIGRPGAISLVAIIPVLGVALLWWIALARWPSQDRNTPGSSVTPRP